MSAGNFEKSMEDLAEAGGDTDTICAIAGQIAGAHLGYSCLPQNLLELASVQDIIAVAKGFAHRIVTTST